MKKILLPLLLILSTIISLMLIGLTIYMHVNDDCEHGLVVDLVPSGEQFSSPFTRVSLPIEGSVICYNEKSYIIKTEKSYYMLIDHPKFYPGMIDYMLDAILSVNDDPYLITKAGKRFRIRIGDDLWRASHISNGEVVMVLITKT